MTRRTYYRKVTTHAEPSRVPTCAEMGVERKCYGCNRKLVIKDEKALWFVGTPVRAVFARCCWTKAASAK